MQLTRKNNKYMYLLFIIHLLLFMNSHFCQLIAGYLFKCVFGFIKSSLHYFVKGEAVSVLFYFQKSMPIGLSSCSLLNIFLFFIFMMFAYQLFCFGTVSYVLSLSLEQSLHLKLFEEVILSDPFCYVQLCCSLVLRLYFEALRITVEILHTSFICTQ